MKQVHSIPYSGSLPPGFFSIPDSIYNGLPFKPAEDKDVVSTLFAMEAERNEIVIYTDHTNIRLAGIFPFNSSVAYFGFWETVDDVAFNKQGFSLMEADARKRNVTSLVGPVNFNTFHNYRLRLNNIPGWNMFDREPVNPTYYPSLLQRSGFYTKATFESRMIKKENIPEAYINKASLLHEITRIPFDFIPLHGGNWHEYEEEIFELVQAIFSENLLYKTISKEQFRLLYNNAFSAKLCPHSSVMFKDRTSGKLVSISMCHPNYQSLYPGVTEPSFDKDFKKLDKKILLAKTVGVHPAFRKMGLMNFMGAYGMLSFRDWYDEVIFCLMRSDNFSLHFTDSLQYESAHYALYEKMVSFGDNT